MDSQAKKYDSSYKQYKKIINLSTKNGTITSAENKAEVTYISRHGLVLWVKDKEYYLPYEKYPWFKKATVDDIFNVRLLGRDHIRWEALDVDLSLGILQNPDQYPLIAK